MRDVHLQGKASILSSVTNLTNTVIGAGALAFPSAFAAMGLIPGILSCIYSGCVTSFGLYLLTRCATMVARRPGDEGRKPSFNEVARITFGKGWATRIFDVSRGGRSREESGANGWQFAIAIKCFGVSISYLIICKVCGYFPSLLDTSHLVHRHSFHKSRILLPKLSTILYRTTPYYNLKTSGCWLQWW